jgi:hypothetical protein
VTSLPQPLKGGVAFLLSNHVVLPRGATYPFGDPNANPVGSLQRQSLWPTAKPPSQQRASRAATRQEWLKHVNKTHLAQQDGVWERELAAPSQGWLVQSRKANVRRWKRLRHAAPGSKEPALSQRDEPVRMW